MADTDGSPFEFSGGTVPITITNSDGTTRKLSDAGVYRVRAGHTISRMEPKQPGENILRMKNPDVFLTLSALKARLNDPTIRERDYNAIKAGEQAIPPKAVLPLELWDNDGTFASLPARLIPTNRPYDDAAQLQRWIDVARNLRRQPDINPVFARFLLKPSPSNTLELVITPAHPPVFGTDAARLEAIIKANSTKLVELGWPKVLVKEYAAAKADMNLKLVGYNFLQLYFTWMKVDDYKKLWKAFNVSELLHPFPPEGENPPDIYEMIDGKLKKGTGNAGTQQVFVTSDKIGNSMDRDNTKTIMGESATTVANEVWKNDLLSTGMGRGIKAEWLHRAAHALGGADSVDNLVFGSWECNTDMIRAENMVMATTKKDGARSNIVYRGTLTTTNNTAGSVIRRGLERDPTSATIPTWVGTKKYSWLCFSLDYLYVMKATESGLVNTREGASFAAKTTFDPWSLYVPLNIEPRLDSWIIRDLRSHGTTSLIPTDPTTLPVDDRASRFKRWILLDASVPDGSFVARGEVEIFGSGIVGKMEQWVGPPPEDVIIGNDPPSIERVIVGGGELRLSAIIPLLRGTPFDDIIFRNVVFYHQNYAFDKTRSIGWHINANWVIDSSCGVLHDALTKALQVKQPVLHLHASLGEQQGWTAPLNIHSFILEGVFPDLTLSPVTGLTLTSIGVRLLGIRGFEFSPGPHPTLSFGYAIFGTMTLAVPGSILPLDLTYEMALVGSNIRLSAEISGRIWEDALGVRNLLLEDVVLRTNLGSTSPWNSFAFDVSARFSYMSSQASLRGSYASGGQFSLTAELGDFGTDEISDIYFELFSHTLTLPDFNVHIGSAALSIASGQGFSLFLRDVIVAECTAASVDVAMSSSGASLSGTLSSTSIAFEDVKLDDAVLKLSLWPSASGKNVDILLGGKVSVDFLSVTLEAAVHLYPGERGVEWAIVAALTAQGEPFALANVVPELKDTFVDFALENAVFIAASKDDPMISQAFPGYHVRQGVQVFALIDRIPALNSLLRQEVTGLVLSADWSSASGFSLLVALPAESTLDFGDGIKTTPITLGIKTSPPELVIMAGVKVPVRDSTPLEFKFELAADVIGASASAQMEGWWNKPFGIDALQIGPEVILGIEIIYEQFVSTGTPSGFRVAGGLMIGNTKASLEMDINENPAHQMLSGRLDNLDISDVVAFAVTLVQADIPNISDGLLTFELLQVYICPMGVVLDGRAYPPGFSFKADLVFLEKRADIECTIDKDQKSVDIIGDVDNFELGPLTVQGLKGPRAELECRVGVSRQKLIVDGCVTLFETRAELYIDVQFLPDPTFKFHSLIKFADVFMIKLDAELLGSINDSLSDADFSLRAELQNDILHYVEQQVIEQLESIKLAVTEDLEAARRKVEEAEKKWKAAIAAAEERLQAKQKAWESHNNITRSTHQPVIDAYLAMIPYLEGKLEDARKVFDDGVRDAERELEEANQKRAASLAAAKRDVDDVQRRVDKDIDGAQRKLDLAEAELSSVFGNAQRVIDGARSVVTGLEDRIRDIQHIIDDYERAPWYEFWKKAAIAGLLIIRGVLEMWKLYANIALHAAQAVLSGGEYLLKVKAVNAARDFLEAVRKTADAALSGVKEALEIADKTTNALVKEAESALDGVGKGVDFIAFQEAEKALKEFKNLNETAYCAAIEAIEWLEKSAEFIAFTAAKAELEVEKGATSILDAANEALLTLEGASQEALTALQKFAQHSEGALDIQTITVSGTLRGVLGAGGDSAQPLSAVIKGYIVGSAFKISVAFDPRQSVAFVTAIFHQMWDIVVQFFKHMEPCEPFPLSARRRRILDDVDLTDIGYSGLEGAKSTFLEHEPAVRQMLVDEIISISPQIPRGIFSNTPMLPPVAVARRILALVQEENAHSVFRDVGEI